MVPGLAESLAGSGVTGKTLATERESAVLGDSERGRVTCRVTKI